MNDEPPEDFNPLNEPMDSQLLQLERELFSLSPVETPRCLASRLERQLVPACSVGKNLAPVASNVVPFNWRRMVVPAAAAVVVVSVLNRMDGPSGFTQTAMAQPGLRSSGSPAAAPKVERTMGYVLKSEPVYISPMGSEMMEHQFLIQPNGQPGIRLSVPRHQSAVIPAVFH